VRIKLGEYNGWGNLVSTFWIDSGAPILSQMAQYHGRTSYAVWKHLCNGGEVEFRRFTYVKPSFATFDR
jgi:hypothetical protein